MQYKTKLSFTLRLVISIATLSILGLAVMAIIVNTTVRRIIYDNVIGVAFSDVRSIALEVDAWFDTGNHIVDNLSRVWLELGVDYIEPTADSFLGEYEYLLEIYAGFADGSYIGGGGWVPDDGWDSTRRPWYIAAAEAPGQLITTIPYRTYKTASDDTHIVTSIAKWVPDLGGMEAVVAIDIKMDYIIDMINQYRLVSGGYLILAGPRGEIISHPNIEYVIGGANEDVAYLKNIPNGGLLADLIISGAELEHYDDFMLGSSYLMTFPIKATGWTLAAIVPTIAISVPVSQNLSVIMLTFAAVLVALFSLTIFFMSLLTKNMEESRVTEERLRIVIDNMPLVTNFRDKDCNILECNSEAVKLFELSSKEEYMQRFSELSPEHQPDGRLSSEKAEAIINEAFKTGRIRFEWMHQKINGEPIPCEVSLTRVLWRGEENLIGFVRDLREINNAVAMVERLEKEAFTDALTNARNRRYFMDKAEKALQASIEGDSHYSLIMIDVDHFKNINDTYGHLVGDEVLKIVVGRITNSLKRGTLVARYGGEEFVVMLTGIGRDKVLKTAERLRKSIESSVFRIDDLEVFITISLGVADRTDVATTLQDIVNNADNALYKAKHIGRNKVVHHD